MEWCTGCAFNAGVMSIMGYTYNPGTDNPTYAQFIYYNISAVAPYVIRCYDGNWYVFVVNVTAI